MPSTFRPCSVTAVVSAALLSFLPAALGAAPPSGTVPVLHAPAAPPEGTTALTFQEQWRAGGEDDEETILGMVSRVLSGPDGQVLVLDSQQNQVFVFGPDGTPLRTLGREGDGPGEFRNAGDMILLPDATVGIIQMFPGKIVKLDLQGAPAGTFVPGGRAAAAGGFNVLVRGKTHGDRVGLVGIAQTFAAGTLSQTRFLAVYAADGTPLDTLVTRENSMDFGNLVLDEQKNDFCWERWDFLPDGGVVVAPARDIYRLEWYGADGRPIRVVERDDPPLHRDQDELAFQRSLLEAQGRFYPTPPKVTVAETEPVIESVHVRPDGTVWILTGRGRLQNPPGVLATYDVFDGNGRFLRRVAVHGEGDPREDALFLLADGRVALIHGLRAASLAAMGGKKDAASAAEDEPAPLELVVGELKP